MIPMHELPWLTAAPSNFNKSCEQLSDHDDLVNSIKQLTESTLSLNQSNRLVNRIFAVEGAHDKLKASFTHVRLGLVSNATVDLILPGLITASLRHGIYLDVIPSGFDQVAQEALDPDSNLNQAELDAVLIALDYRGYPFANNSLATTVTGQTAANGVAYLNQIRDGFRTNSDTPCILQSLATPPFSLAGNLDIQLSGMLRNEIVDFNAQISESILQSSDLLLDVATIANSLGVYHWFDERQWYMSRLAIANDFIPLYCDHVARVVAAMRGKSKKCLVLDLDNTLWGGVVGDDGLDGIHIGSGNAVGESHLAIQQYASELKKIGVILAVCSKNEPNIATQVFKEHPDMLLKEDDFAVFIANWEDKASNIRHIAERLNIGLDSIVFVDDNPVERDLVRKLAPDVAVPELPADPALIPRVLAAAGYFEMTSFTQEDANRSEQYTANAKRSEMLAASGDISGFLADLNMHIHFSEFDQIGRKRIAQLINKTNQFNLTTQRYSEAEVEQFETSETTFTRQIRLTDRFGDNGMISVLICHQKDDCWEIGTWLMSCRVIRRRVEESVCDDLVQAASQRDIRLIRGFYRPTEKNKLVEDHYKKLGFKNIESNPNQEIWELDVSSYQPKKPPINIIE